MSDIVLPEDVYNQPFYGLMSMLLDVYSRAAIEEYKANYERASSLYDEARVLKRALIKRYEGYNGRVSGYEELREVK